jgi:hypothetical protein
MKKMDIQRIINTYVKLADRYRKNDTIEDRGGERLKNLLLTKKYGRGNDSR